MFQLLQTAPVCSLMAKSSSGIRFKKLPATLAGGNLTPKFNQRQQKVFLMNPCFKYEVKINSLSPSR